VSADGKKLNSAEEFTNLVTALEFRFNEFLTIPRIRKEVMAQGASSIEQTPWPYIQFRDWFNYHFRSIGQPPPMLKPAPLASFSHRSASELTSRDMSTSSPAETGTSSEASAHSASRVESKTDALVAASELTDASTASASLASRSTRRLGLGNGETSADMSTATQSTSKQRILAARGKLTSALRKKKGAGGEGDVETVASAPKAAKQGVSNAARLLLEKRKQRESSLDSEPTITNESLGGIGGIGDGGA